MLRIDGGKLRQLRLTKLLTREELDEQAGLDESHLGVIERAEVRESRIRTVRRLAHALEVDANEFLAAENPDSLGEK
jgi:transcriptional regulator with XRE-family HTH domain